MYADLRICIAGAERGLHRQFAVQKRTSSARKGYFSENTRLCIASCSNFCTEAGLGEMRRSRELFSPTREVMPGAYKDCASVA
jgi:hypothetical protein